MNTLNYISLGLLLTSLVLFLYSRFKLKRDIDREKAINKRLTKVTEVTSDIRSDIRTAVSNLGFSRTSFELSVNFEYNVQNCNVNDDIMDITVGTVSENSLLLDDYLYIATLISQSPFITSIRMVTAGANCFSIIKDKDHLIIKKKDDTPILYTTYEELIGRIVRSDIDDILYKIVTVY